MLAAVKAEGEQKRCIIELPWLVEKVDRYTNSRFDRLLISFIDNRSCNNHIVCRIQILLVYVRQCSESDD